MQMFVLKNPCPSTQKNNTFNLVMFNKKNLIYFISQVNKSEKDLKRKNQN